MYAPTFFAAGYFAAAYFAPGGLAPGAGGGYFAGTFLAPGYFPPTYFAGTGTTLVRSPEVRATSLDEVLLATRRMLLAAGIGSESTIAVSLNPDPTPTASTTMFFVGPGAFRSVEAAQRGTGRAFTTLDGSFTIDVVSSDNRDQGERALHRLTDESRNILADAHRVIRFLQERFIEDLDGNHLSLEPILLDGQAEPRLYGKSSTYAGVKLRFTLLFQLRMD